MDAQNNFLAQAQLLLGPKGLTQDPDLLAPWLTDWRGRYTGRAIAMASPESTQQVADLVRLCADHGIAIVPQGGNSGMSGGATPDDSGNAIILSLRRMNTIYPVDKQAQQVVCDAGVVLQDLHEAAHSHHLRFPLTLGGKGSATVGGLIATNAGGTQVLRHGVMRHQVLGVEAVMADGSIFHSLDALKKDNRGFDLKQLLIGSEGTLGIITRARLRLLPEIADRYVIWSGTDRLSNARELLLICEAELGDILEGFEVLPQHSHDAVMSYLPDARSPLEGPHSWHILIELAVSQGQNADMQARAETVLSHAMDTGLVQDAVIAANERQAEDFWLIRETVAPAERALGPAMQHDISVPVAQMADFVDMAVPEVERIFPGTTAIAFGHLGDGNVHFHVLAPAGAPAQEWETTEGKAVSRLVHDLVTKWGGSISAEHGIGQIKVDELARLTDPARLRIMRQIKQALDPQNILNPGKLVNLAQSVPAS
ncbi:MAG: FAD-binding oxidoreductase [Sphingomonadaceae bacterium]